MNDLGAAGALTRLSAQTGEEFSHLAAARDLAAARQPDLEARLGELQQDSDSSVVLFGSWARRELTEHSDDDWLVLIEGSRRGETHPTLEEVGAILGVDDRKPGQQEVFGINAFCDDIAEKVGLDGDDNKNLTHRVLLMLESVPFSGHSVHRACWERILDGYLDELRRDGRPPRFFLNDVGAGMRSFLVEQLKAPATDRLAYAFLQWGVPDTGARFFEAYDRWIDLLNDKAAREELEGVTPTTADSSDAFRTVQGIAKDLDRTLLALLFDTELAPISQQYAVF